MTVYSGMRKTELPAHGGVDDRFEAAAGMVDRGIDRLIAAFVGDVVDLGEPFGKTSSLRSGLRGQTWAPAGYGFEKEVTVDVR